MKINWDEVKTDVVASIIVLLIAPLIIPLAVAALIGFLLLVVIDMGTGGSSLTQIAEKITDMIQSRQGGP